MSDGWINPYDTPEPPPAPVTEPPPDFIEPPPLDDPEAEARRQGYSWPEIKDHIGSATATALQHGYSAREIDEFLGRKDPAPFEARARAGWLGSMAGDPSLLETIEPAASPTMREDYADALLAGEVRGPQDFAYRYTAAALDAAYNGMGLDDSDALAVRERQTEGAFAADALTAELPSREDLVDATLALTANDREADHDQVRGNLMDHWLETGQDPAHAALQAQYDADLGEKLRSPPEPPAPPWYARFGAGVGDMFSGATQMIEKAAPGVLHGPGAAMTEFGVPEGLLYADQLPNTYFADAAKARLQELRAAGMPDGDWLRIAGQMVATIPLATTLGLSGGWAWMAAGATGSAAMAAFTPSEAENYWTNKAEDVAISGVAGAAGGLVLAGGFKLLGKLISKMAPDAADHLAYLFRSLKEPEVPITDPGAPPGTAPRMVPASEAFRPVEPAGLAYRKAAGYEAGEPPPIAVQAPDVLEHPPIPQGQVRLYRVEGGGEPSRVPDWLKDTEEFKNTVSSTGRWFTNDFHELDFYRRDRGAGHRIVAVDVPAAEAEQYRVSNIALNIDRQRSENPAFYSARPEKEFFLPADVAAGKRELPAGLDPNASPAQKIERIAQDAGEARTDPKFFENKLAAIGETDPATVELAKAHDTAAGYLNWLKNVFSDLLTDESGALRLFPAKAAKAPAEERGAIILGKNEAERLVREMANGMAMQTVEHIKQGFEPMRKIVAPHLPEWEAGLEKVYAAKGPMEASAAVNALKNTVIGRYFQAVEGNGAIDPSRPLAELVQLRRSLNGIVDKDLAEAMVKGDLQPFQMREFYMAHIYDMGKTPVGGRGGSVGFTKARTYDNYFDALEEGHHLRFTNPLDIDIASDQGKLNTLATLRVQALAKDNNFIRSFSDPKEVEPGWLPLTGLMSKKQVGIADGGVVTHQLYAPPGFARLYNNHIGYQDYTNASTTFKNFEDGLLRMKNLSTHLKLLMPLYHAVAEYKEGIAAGIGNSLLELTGGLKRGDMGEMLRGMRDMALAPIKPIQYIYRAGQTERVTGRVGWREMYRAAEQDPALAALNPDLKAMQAFVAGGGNIARRDKAYQESSAATIWQSWARGELGQELRKDIPGAIFPRLTPGNTDVQSLVGLPFHELSRLSTSLSAPIWDHYIPLLKSGAAMERIQTYLRQNPNADDEAVKFFAKQVVTQMEDRFGEYNMNNLFWRPALRRATNQAMLSTSWTYGTVHSLLTGLGWNPGRGVEWNPVATADLVGHLATIAFTNAAWTYGIDGKLPDTYYDYLIPFANARGLKRVLLPGQEKEFYDWLGVIRKSVSVGMDQGVAAGMRKFSGELAHYAFGKTAPIYQAAAAWLMGEDGIGHKLDYEPGGPVAFLKNAFMPIFISGWDQAKADGLNTVENLFGIRGAPKWFEDWDGFRAQEQKLHQRWTKEELSRAGREATLRGDEPPEGYRTPRQAGGGGRGAGGGGSAAASPISSPGISSYAAPQGSGYGGVADTSGGTPVYRGGSYGGGGRRIALPRGRARTPRPANLLPARLRTKNRRGF